MEKVKEIFKKQYSKKEIVIILIIIILIIANIATFNKKNIADEKIKVQNAKIIELEEKIKSSNEQILRLGKNDKQEEINSKIRELEDNKNNLINEKTRLETEITSLKEEVIKLKGEPKTYPAGHLTAGTDVPTGKYKIYGGSSNFVVYSSSGSLNVNIILGSGYLSVSEYIYTFSIGDKIEADSSFKLVSVE